VLRPAVRPLGVTIDRLGIVLRDASSTMCAQINSMSSSFILVMRFQVRRIARGYLLPIDAGSNRVELTGYPLEPLMVKLAKFPSRIMTVYPDACFSGESENATLVRSTSEIIIQANLPCSARRMIGCNGRPR